MPFIMHMVFWVVFMILGSEFRSAKENGRWGLGLACLLGLPATIFLYYQAMVNWS